MKQIMKEDRHMQDLKTKIKNDPKKYPEYTIDNDMKFYHAKGRPRQLYVPNDVKQDLKKQYHSSPFSSHYGMNATTQKLISKYYWPEMHQDIVYFINNCQKCNQTKGRTATANIYPYATEKPMEQLLSDIMGPLPKTTTTNKYIITFMDRYTSWLEAYALPSIETKKIANLLIDEWIT